MAAQGFVVFNPNYRGSDNLGGTFQRGVIGNAGDGPGKDVMAGVEVCLSSCMYKTLNPNSVCNVHLSDNQMCWEKKANALCLSVDDGVQGLY